MYRKIMGFLEAWKDREHRKPLILQGARQVGKTYSILEFGRTHYENVAYFNFETNPKLNETSVYKGYKQDKIEMRGDRAEMSDFPLYLNTVAGGLDCRNQAIGGFSFVVKIYALPVVEIIGKFLYLLGRYGFDAQIGYGF